MKIPVLSKAKEQFTRSVRPKLSYKDILNPKDPSEEVSDINVQGYKYVEAASYNNIRVSILMSHLGLGYGLLNTITTLGEWLYIPITFFVFSIFCLLMAIKTSHLHWRIKECENAALKGKLVLSKDSLSISRYLVSVGENPLTLFGFSSNIK